MTHAYDYIPIYTNTETLLSVLMTSSYPDLDMHERAWVAGMYVHTTGDKSWFL